MSENIIECIGVYHKYGKKTILSDINFSIAKGEVIGLLGPNGSGKTTLFYILSGIMKPYRGQLLYKGQDIINMPLYMRARSGLVYLPQESSVFPDLTVENNIMVAIELFIKSKPERRQKLEKLLNLFSLEHVAKSQAIVLSGGERRKLEIARCLVCNPSIILFDEPYAGIDPISINEIKKVILSLAKDGVSCFITDHNVDSTIEITDKVLITYQSKILFEGPPKEALEHEEVKRFYLG